MKTVFRQKSNMWVRPNTSDDLVIDEAVDYTGLFTDLNDNDIFMDIGQNIGAVSRLALDINSNIKVFGYEPDEENYKVCDNNLIGSMEVLPYAIGTGHKTIKLYQAKGSNKGKISTVLRKENCFKDFKEVVQVDFKTEVENHRPTIIKVDIEGGEYNIDFISIPLYVKALAIEIHKIGDDWLSMKKLYEDISKQFGYQLGDIPVDDDWYKDRDCFMTIFLRNVK